MTTKQSRQNHSDIAAAHPATVKMSEAIDLNGRNDRSPSAETTISATQQERSDEMVRASRSLFGTTKRSRDSGSDASIVNDDPFDIRTPQGKEKTVASHTSKPVGKPARKPLSDISSTSNIPKPGQAKPGHPSVSKKAKFTSAEGVTSKATTNRRNTLPAPAKAASTKPPDQASKEAGPSKQPITSKPAAKATTDKNIPNLPSASNPPPKCQSHPECFEILSNHAVIQTQLQERLTALDDALNDASAAEARFIASAEDAEAKVKEALERFSSATTKADTAAVKSARAEAKYNNCNTDIQGREAEMKRREREVEIEEGNLEDKKEELEEREKELKERREELEEEYDEVTTVKAEYQKKVGEVNVILQRLKVLETGMTKTKKDGDELVTSLTPYNHKRLITREVLDGDLERLDKKYISRYYDHPDSLQERDRESEMEELIHILDANQDIVGKKLVDEETLDERLTQIESKCLLKDKSNPVATESFVKTQVKEGTKLASEVKTDLAKTDGLLATVKTGLEALGGDVATISKDYLKGEAIAGIPQLTRDIAGLTLTSTEHSSSITKLTNDLGEVKQDYLKSGAISALPKAIQDIAGLATTLNDHSASISKLEGELDEVTEDYLKSSSISHIPQVIQNIANLATTTTTQATTIKALETKFNDVDSKFNGLETQVTGIDNKVKGVEGDLIGTTKLSEELNKTSTTILDTIADQYVPQIVDIGEDENISLIDTVLATEGEVERQRELLFRAAGKLMGEKDLDEKIKQHDATISTTYLPKVVKHNNQNMDILATINSTRTEISNFHGIINGVKGGLIGVEGVDDKLKLVKANSDKAYLSSTYTDSDGQLKDKESIWNGIVDASEKVKKVNGNIIGNIDLNDKEKTILASVSSTYLPKDEEAPVATQQWVKDQEYLDSAGLESNLSQRRLITESTLTAKGYETVESSRSTTKRLLAGISGKVNIRDHIRLNQNHLNLHQLVNKLKAKFPHYNMDLMFLMEGKVDQKLHLENNQNLNHKLSSSNTRLSITEFLIQRLGSRLKRLNLENIDNFSIFRDQVDTHVSTINTIIDEIDLLTLNGHKQSTDISNISTKVNTHETRLGDIFSNGNARLNNLDQKITSLEGKHATTEEKRISSETTNSRRFQGLAGGIKKAAFLITIISLSNHSKLKRVNKELSNIFTNLGTCLTKDKHRVDLNILTDKIQACLVISLNRFSQASTRIDGIDGDIELLRDRITEISPPTPPTPQIEPVSDDEFDELEEEDETLDLKEDVDLDENRFSPPPNQELPEEDLPNHDLPPDPPSRPPSPNQRPTLPTTGLYNIEIPFNQADGPWPSQDLIEKLQLVNNFTWNYKPLDVNPIAYARSSEVGSAMLQTLTPLLNFPVTLQLIEELSSPGHRRTFTTLWDFQKSYEISILILSWVMFEGLRLDVEAEKMQEICEVVLRKVGTYGSKRSFWTGKTKARKSDPKLTPEDKVKALELWAPRVGSK